MSNSAFRDWFMEQFKAMPTAGKLSQLSIDLEKAHRKISSIKAAIYHEEKLTDAWQAALYGWNARRDSK